MNREIKFRGKRIYNGEWIYGFYFKTEVGCFVGEYNEEHEVVPDSVGQYIGLEDINGTPLYEGEIIFNTDRKEFAVISYSEEQAMFITKYVITEDEYPASLSVSNLYYSVGNICEHSHLLNIEQEAQESDTTKAQ